MCGMLLMIGMAMCDMFLMIEYRMEQENGTKYLVWYVLYERI